MQLKPTAGLALLTSGTIGLTLLLGSCARAPAAGGGAQYGESPAATEEPATSEVTSASARASGTDTSGTPGGAQHPSLVARFKEGPTLPRVSLRNVGLHIGGGPNDATTKSPFKRAIEAQFQNILACYRLSEQGAKGGTFGLDLLIGRKGGSPQVRQPRTAMRGVAFRRCVVRAFERVNFDKPRKGPTVISYSLRFEVAPRD